MSQRLVNVVCMILTLAAAVCLYVFMQEYSMSGSESADVPMWEEAESGTDTWRVNPDGDVMPTEGVGTGRQSNRVEPPSRPLDVN